MHISPPGEIERKFIAEYSRVRSRLLAPPARIRPNGPMPEPDVRSEPLAENVCDATPAIEPANEPSIALPWLPEVKRDLPAETRLTCRFIFEHVAAFYRITMVDLLSNRRQRRVVWPRHVAMYLARHMTTRSLPEVGRKLGGKDHTTVLHGVARITERLPDEPALAADVTELMRRIAAGEPVLVQPPPEPKPRRGTGKIKKRRKNGVLEEALAPKVSFWTAQRDAELTRFWHEGVLVEDMSERFGKSPSAIRDRANRLGLPLRRGHWQEIVREVQIS
jgi:hypothetical protein